MFQKASELQAQGIMSVMVTITNVKGSTPRELGAKMLVTADTFFGSVGGGALEWLALEQARELLKNEASQKMSVPLCSKAHQCCGGFVELFFDLVRPRPRAFIFGAGHVTQSLLEVLAGTQFHCVLIDERPEWIEAAQIKRHALSQLSIETHCMNPLKWIEDNKNHFNSMYSYGLVLTHDHALDEGIIEKLAHSSFHYLGLIGSATKHQRFFDRLQKKGLSSEQLEKIHCPMGIPLPGKAPKEVALSIGAQLIEFLHRSNEVSASQRGVGALTQRAEVPVSHSHSKEM